MSAALFSASRNPDWSAYRIISPLDYASLTRIVAAKHDSNIRYVISNLVDATSQFGYVARLDVSGNILWAVKITNATYTSSSVSLYNICLDDTSSNIYIVGSAYDGSTSRTLGILVKINNTGSIQWYKTYDPGGNGNLNFRDVELDPTSFNIIVCGSRFTGATSGFLGKWNSSGTNLALKRFSFSSDTGSSIAVDATGNVYVVGSSAGYAAFWKFNNSLSSVLLNKRITAVTGGNGGLFEDIAVIPGDTNLAIGGMVQATNYYTFGNHFFVASVDASTGNISWTRTFNRASAAQNQSSYCSGVSVDSDLSIYAVGRHSNSGTTHMQIIRLNSSGNLIWQKKIVDGNTNSNIVLQSVTAVGTTTGSNYIGIAGVRGNSNGYQPYNFVGRIRKDGSVNTGTAFFSLCDQDFTNTNQSIALENLPTFIENQTTIFESAVQLSFSVASVSYSFKWAV